MFPDGAGTRVEATGLPLGLFAFSEYSVHKLRLRPNQGLLLYTDGVTEATNRAGEEFGMDRLSGFLDRHSHLSAPDLVRACGRTLSEFKERTPASDDVTIMVVRQLETAAR